MKTVLLVSATEFEIEPALEFLKNHKGIKPRTYLFGKIEVEVCITGVGMVSTAFELGKLAGRNFDAVINAGVAGNFGLYKIGDVVNVTKECFSELGAEDDEKFLSLDELGLGKQKLQMNNRLQAEAIKSLPQAFGITVNTVHGNEESIRKVISLYQPEIESMEGGAFIYAANAFNWRAIELRALSNHVEKRNRENWDLPLAIKNLNAVVIELIKELNRTI
jgi:futalosine hydrolase